VLFDDMKRHSLPFIITGVYVLLCSSCQKDEDPDPREQFVASYSISDSWTLDGGGSGTEFYTINIAKSKDDLLKIIISNLGNTIAAYGEQMDVEAEYFGKTFNMESQTIKLGIYSVTVEGTGLVHGDSITVSYVIANHWQGKCKGIRQ